MDCSYTDTTSRLSSDHSYVHAGAIVMGGWFSSQAPEERVIRSHRRSSNYEKNFYQVCKVVEKTIKILLLGT